MHRFSPRIRLTLALGAALTACTMPPRPPPIERTEVFSAPYDEVWDATKTWFTSKGLPATFDRTSGLIHAGSRMHPGSAHDWARCGGRPDPTVMGHTLSMEVSVKAIGEAQTSVSADVGVEQALAGGGMIYVDSCESGGTLEADLFRAIRERTAASPQ